MQFDSFSFDLVKVILCFCRCNFYFIFPVQIFVNQPNGIKLLQLNLGYKKRSHVNLKIMSIRSV